MLDRFLEVLVGGGDDPEIAAQGGGAAHPAEFPGLQHPQQVNLHLHGNVAHFVQEEGAGIGHFQAALLGVFGVGEGAFLVAEELALQELLGEGPAVDGNEGGVAPRALGMDGPGHQFFAGAGFPGDQDGGIGLRHIDNGFKQLDHGRGLAHQVFKPGDGGDPLLQDQVFHGQVLHLHQFLDGEAEFLEVEGLEQIVVGAQLHGLHRVLNGAVGGHHDDGDIGIGFLELFEQGQAVHFRHLDVDEHDVEPVLGVLGQGRRTAGRGLHLVAVLLQPALQGLADAQFVIHYQ